MDLLKFLSHNKIKKILSNAIDVIFPIECLGCATEEVGWVCEKCVSKITIYLLRKCPFCENTSDSGATCAKCKEKHSLDGAIASVPYSDKLIQSLIHAWKYQGILSLTQNFSKIVKLGLDKETLSGRAKARRFFSLEEKIKNLESEYPDFPTALFGSPAILIPIPLHRKKLKERGFNQAEELAFAIENYRQNWKIKNILQRKKRTDSQATLSFLDRAINTKNAFQIIQGEKEHVKGANILLIDDVITTANTCEECARILKKSGAKSVWAITIAYGHPANKKPLQ